MILLKATSMKRIMQYIDGRTGYESFGTEIINPTTNSVNDFHSVESVPFYIPVFSSTSTCYDITN